MTNDNMSRGFGSFLGAFLLGAATGAAIALLTAPRTGRETRARLKDAALDLKERMNRVPDAVRTAGSRARRVGQTIYDQVRDGIGTSEPS